MELIQLKDKFIKSGMDDVVLTRLTNNSTQIKFSNNKIVKTGTELIDYISIFLVKDKKILTTGIKDFSKQHIEKTIKTCSKLINKLPRKEDYYGIAKGPFKYKKLKETYDKRINSIDQVDMVNAAINASINEGAKRTNGIFETHEVDSRLLTSNNIDIKDKQTQLYLSIRSLIEKDSSGHITISSRTLKNFNPEKAGKESGIIAKQSLNPQPGKGGEYDILFSPLAFAPLLSIIGESASAFSVDAGLSFLEGMINKKVSNNNITIIDDPYYPNALRSTSFDDEGYPTKPLKLIYKGIFKTYLHNTSTARKYNTKTTGHAGLISPTPWNVKLNPGKLSNDKLIQNIKKGIYITNIWYTRFTSYKTGEFSTIPRDGAFYIENGEIKYPIKNIRVSDTMPNILKNIEEIGNNLTQIRSWEAGLPVLTPSVFLKDIGITTPTS